MPRRRQQITKRRLPQCAPELLAWWEGTATAEQEHEAFMACWFEVAEVIEQWNEVRSTILPKWIQDPARFAAQADDMRVFHVLTVEDVRSIWGADEADRYAQFHNR